MKRAVLALLTFVLSGTLSAAEPNTSLPEQLKCTQSIDTSSSPAVWTVLLTWDDVAGESGYRVQRSVDAGNWELVAELGANSTSYADNSVDGGILYFYRIQVLDGGVRGNSNLLFVRTGDRVAAGQAPDRFYAYWTPDGDIELYWNDMFADEELFRIEFKEDGAANWSALTTTNAGTQKYVYETPTAGVSHYFRIRAESAGDESDWAESPAGLSAPSSMWLMIIAEQHPNTSVSAPTNLQAQRLDSCAIRLQWDATSDPVTILRRWDGTPWQTMKTVSSGSSYDLSNVFLGRTQHFAIYRNTSEGPSPCSSIVQVDPFPVDLTLHPPSNLQATKSGDDIVLTWTDNSQSETGFAIQEFYGVSAAPDQFREIATVNANITTYTVTGGGIYDHYRVQALGTTGNSIFTQEAQAGDNIGGTPQNLQVVELTSSTVKLTWDKLDPYYYGYIIRRAVDGGEYHEIALPKIDSETPIEFIDKTVRPGHTYHYKVGSMHPFLDSDPVSATPPAPSSPPANVSGLTATGASRTQVTLNWAQGSTTPVTAYVIQRKGPGEASYTELATVDVDTTSHSDTSCSAGEIYSYKVIARNAAGDASGSTKSVTTPSSDPSVSTSVKTSSVGNLKTLIVRGTNADDTLSLHQSGDTITVMKNGSTVATKTGSYAEIKFYGKMGDDTLSVDSSITTRVLLYGGDGNDTLTANGSAPQWIIAIGHGKDECSGADGLVNYWTDDELTDTITASAADFAARRVHQITRFHFDRSKVLNGQNFDEFGVYSGWTKTKYPNNPLFGRIPSLLDVHQGTNQDCPFTSSYQAYAYAAPDPLQTLAVDLGDNTYAVSIVGGYHRMDNELTPGLVSLLPKTGSLWWLVMEKAYYCDPVLEPRDQNDQSGYNAARDYRHDDGEFLFQKCKAAFAAGRTIGVFTRRQEVDYNFGSPGQHAHTMVSCFRADDGTPRFVIRNPYGDYYEQGYGDGDWRSGMRIATYGQLVSYFNDPYFVSYSNSQAYDPVALDRSASVAVGSSVPIELQGFDVDGRAVTYEILNNPSRGTITGTLPYIYYTPSGSTSGIDSFTYRVNNGLSNSTSATVSITITGGGSAPGTIALTDTAVTIDEDAGTLTLTLTRSGGTDGAVSIDYSTADDSATAGEDYTAKSGTVEWSNGDSANKEIVIDITDDNIAEDDENFTVTLDNATGGATLGSATATITISGNDHFGELGFFNTAVAVDEDAGTVSLTVKRQNGSDGAVSIDYSTNDGDAVAGSDYTANSATLTWTDGDSADKIITIDITDDATEEPDENFTVTLDNVTGGATAGSTSATITINGNDHYGTIGFLNASATVDESAGTLTLIVKRIDGSDGAVSVDFATTDDSAQAGNDYTANSGNLNWADGDSVDNTITIDITDDVAIESDESFSVVLSNLSSGASMGTSECVVTILANDVVGNNAPVIESPATATPNTITLAGNSDLSVSASDPDGDTLTYTWSTASGPATANVAPNGTIDADSAVATFTVAGNYELEVFVSDGNGGSASSSVTVMVQPVASDCDIAITGNAVTIESGDTSPDEQDHTDFGSANVDSGTITRRFTIHNNGTGELNLTGSPRVALSGANAADFAVTTSPSSPVAAGESTTVEITFDPSAEGAHSASITVESDDSDTPSYTFDITGNGITSEDPGDDPVPPPSGGSDGDGGCVVGGGSLGLVWIMLAGLILCRPSRKQ